MSPLLGCIADDFTGATDLANTLTRQGMCTVVLLGVPRSELTLPESDAVVIALKSRSNPASDAVRMSLAALEWLKHAGARQFYFKYCSTFDSSDAGNIGPVADALLEQLCEPFTIACPAFPANKRTVYQGHLFVGGDLLSESSMREHPLTPMTDASLVRVLQRQTQGRVGLIPFSVVDRGVEAIDACISALQAQGYRYAIVDALTEAHLLSIGAACADMKLLTGGSGLALGLPDNFRQQGLLKRRSGENLPQVDGPAAVLAGSCSAATQRQVAAMKQDHEHFELDPVVLARQTDPAAEAMAWAQSRIGAQPILIYSTAEPERVAAAQSKLGRERSGAVVEQALAQIAKRLVDSGVRRMVVAGGETSGAVVSALGIQGLRVGREIDPGVPWTVSLSDAPVALALKSGNFGGDDFFMKAFDALCEA
ncbi:MAG TPA: 3-oxo-tetronate kinase [Burkholderiales bacterium]|nr:3-oxo-tetronate kinase [Burkholderiales bacterium]